MIARSRAWTANLVPEVSIPRHAAWVFRNHGRNASAATVPPATVVESALRFLVHASHRMCATGTKTLYGCVYNPNATNTAYPAALLQDGRRTMDRNTTLENTVQHAACAYGRASRLKRSTSGEAA